MKRALGAKARWRDDYRRRGSVSRHVHCESKKTVLLFAAYNFRNIEQIFTKFGTNQSLFILNIVPELSCQSLFKSTLENSGAI